MKSKFSRWFIGLCILVGATRVHGADRPVEMDLPQDPPELLAKVKHRLYAGGPDEEDLQVQQTLAKPQRKIMPVQDEEEEMGSQD